MRCLSIVGSLYFTVFSALSSIGLDTLRDDSHLTPKKGDPHTQLTVYIVTTRKLMCSFIFADFTLPPPQKKSDPHTITGIYCNQSKAHAQFHLRIFHFINTTRLQTVQSSYLFELFVHLSSDANIILTSAALLLESAMKCDYNLL